MKQQPCASSRRPSKLCRLLLCVFTVKLALLGLMLFDPALPDMRSLIPGLSPATEAVSGGVALAATGDGAAGAPPAVPTTVPSTLPSIGAQTQVPQTGQNGPQNTGMPSAASQQQQRTLPGINSNPAPAVQGGASGTEASVTLDSLARRQEELGRKEQELRVLEGEINAKLEQLQMLENRLAAMIRDAEETKDAKFRHLVDVLSNMKAKQAAAVLETLDQKIAVRVLSGMRGRQAGEILTFVRPEVAAHLTEALARMQLPFE